MDAATRKGKGSGNGPNVLQLEKKRGGVSSDTGEKRKSRNAILVGKKTKAQQCGEEYSGQKGKEKKKKKLPPFQTRGKKKKKNGNPRVSYEGLGWRNLAGGKSGKN